MEPTQDLLETRLNLLLMYLYNSQIPTSKVRNFHLEGNITMVKKIVVTQTEMTL